MHSCIKTDQNNHLYVDTVDLPKDKFVSVVQCVDLVQFYVASVRRRKVNDIDGNADVVVLDTLNRQSNISRQQLVSNYVHTKNTKIQCRTLHSDKVYKAYRVIRDDSMVALRLPKELSVRDSKLNISAPGCYVVTKCGEDGQPDLENVAVVSKDVFKKTFAVPMQPLVAQMIKGVTDKEYNPNTARAVAVAKKQTAKPVKHRVMQGVQLSKVSANSTEKKPANVVNNVARNQNTRPVVNKEKAPSYKYSVVKRVVNINNKLVGFMVLDNETGAMDRVSTQKLSGMCSKGVVSNAILVTNSDGIQYLRGKGVELTKLPSVIA